MILSSGIQTDNQTTNKFDDSTLVTHFSELQVPVLQLQTNPMTAFW